MNITLYFLALFMSKYLHTNQPELALEELDISKELKEEILSGSIA